MDRTADKLPRGKCVLARGTRANMTQKACEDEGGKFIIDPWFARRQEAEEIISPSFRQGIFHPGGSNPVGMAPPTFRGGEGIIGPNFIVWPDI